MSIVKSDYIRVLTIKLFQFDNGQFIPLPKYACIYVTWLAKSTMWVEITLSYNFANIFSCDCSILFL